MKTNLAPKSSYLSTSRLVVRKTVLAALVAGLTLSSLPGAQAASSAAADCGCEMPWREYTRKPTPEVLQLFQAARTADEASFTRLIATIPDVQEYAVKGEPLLAALLRPVESLAAKGRKTWSQLSPEETAQLRAAHAATLAAKTRMLALALEHGASVKDTSRDEQHPPLHLAMVFGTPEMVRLLLQHGADPNQVESMDQRTPIEFALDHEFFVRMTYLPDLVEPPARTQMLLDVLAAGAKRPYLRIDEAKRPAEETLPRPAADYLVWPALAELTVGAEVMEAMAKTGTTPACDPDMVELSPLGHAARSGNLGGVRWLKAHLPRTVVSPDRYGHGPDVKADVWLAAAIWALYPPVDTPAAHARSREILGELMVKGMAWEQTNTLRDDERNALISRSDVDSPEGGSTLLHHLVNFGDVDLVQRAVELGAPIDGVPAPGKKTVGTTALATAVGKHDIAMVKRLLDLGADPLAGPGVTDSAFFDALAYSAIRDDGDMLADPARFEAARRAVLAVLLARLTPAQKQVLDAQHPTPVGHVLERHFVDGATVHMLLAAGFSAKEVDGNALRGVMSNADRSLVTDLLDHGARISADPVPATPGRPARASDTPSPLVDAVAWGRTDLIERLVALGADPNQRNGEGMSAVEVAIARADMAALDALLAHGGRIDTTPRRAPKAQPSALDYAVRSGDPAMIDRVAAFWGNDLSSVCLIWREALPDLISRPDDALWNSWLQRRLGQPTDPTACEATPLAERVVLGALEREDTAVVGWYAQRFEARLRTLMGFAIKSGQLTREHASTWSTLARQAGRDDLVTALGHIGVVEPRVAPAKTRTKPRVDAKAAAKAAAADRALTKSLVGHYYLSNVREVGSELLLKADGSFEYALAYGAEDQQAQGRWTVRDGHVVFSTERAAAPAGWQPFKLQAAPAPGKSAQTTVSVHYRGRPIAPVAITLMGCAAPQMAFGATNEDGKWAAKLDVPVCQIVLQHPQVDHGHAFIQQIAQDAAGTARRDFAFEYVPSTQPAGVDFNVEMLVDDGALVREFNGRPMRYERQ